MFLDDMAKLLSDASIGVVGKSIFATSKSDIPTGDGPYIFMRETGGQAPWIMHNSTDDQGRQIVPAYQRPSAQIVALAKSATTALASAKAAYFAFVQKRRLTINGCYYLSIDVIQEPGDILGLDGAGRIQYSFNIRAVKRPS